MRRCLRFPSLRVVVRAPSPALRDRATGPTGPTGLQGQAGRAGPTGPQPGGVAKAPTGAPVSNAKRDVWVTETALATALNVSYMADQLGNFGLVVGIALLLAGIGFIVLAASGALRRTATEPAVAPVAET